MRSSRRLALILIVALCTTGAGRGPDPDRLLFHAEALDGTVLASRGADRAFNPASVVKVATSLWALETLGPEHRFTTEVGYRGAWDRDTGRIDGQLVVVGGSDPDFHDENAFLVARQLNALGVREISDGLVVSGPFVMGWEHGEEKRLSDPRKRAALMARRLRDSLDPTRWDRSARGSWHELCRRRGWDAAQRPLVRIANGVAVVDSVEHTPLLRHRSGPVRVVLRRFNVYSNNDIVRVADALGGTGELERWLAKRIGAAAGDLELATASGEGRNRMTARQVVRLLREFRNSTGRLGLRPHEVLPLPGCDPGPAARMFPLLSSGQRARTVTLKTGTLRTTDNGVAVLSGMFSNGSRGDVLFCVAAPGAGNHLRQWRRLEQSWLIALMDRLGGARAHSCGHRLPLSDTWAAVEVVPAVEEEVAASASRATLRGAWQTGVCQALSR
jgi:D-alanyl-D-alanine carboxypeptidase/D-alanyl-D-alanine-endopeptidase (penicillin-binding protein 4)